MHTKEGWPVPWGGGRSAALSFFLPACLPPARRRICVTCGRTQAGWPSPSPNSSSNPNAQCRVGGSIGIPPGVFNAGIAPPGQAEQQRHWCKGYQPHTTQQTRPEAQRAPAINRQDSVTKGVPDTTSLPRETSGLLTTTDTQAGCLQADERQ